ncbi:MAG: ABC transporter substrate-binding protein [Chloroflexota bacterium]
MYSHTFFYRLLCALVAASMMLTACSSGTQTGPSASATAGGTPQPASKPTESNPGSEQEDSHPVITFAASEWERSLYEPLIEQFNTEHPEMTVQFAPLPDNYGVSENGEVQQDYTRMLASSGDTFIIGGVIGVPESYLRDIQPLIEADPTSEVDDFWPGALETCQDIEGRQLGVPLWLGINGIFYDAEVFEAAGQPLPKPGWTWDEFRITLSALAKTEGENRRYALVEQYSSILTPLIEAVVDENGGEVDAETLQPIIQWYLDLVEAKAIYPPGYYEEGKDEAWQKYWEEMQNLFKGENRPAMWPGSITDYIPGGDYFSPNEEDPMAGMAIKEFGFAPYPVAADNPNDKTSPLWSQCAAISSGSKNPRAAWKWLNFLSRQRLVRDSYGPWEKLQLPARSSVADAAGYWDMLPGGSHEAIRYIVAHGWYGSAYPEVTYSVMDAVNKVVAGKAALAAALAEAETARTASTTPSPTPNTTPIVVATPRPTLSADTTVIDYYASVWGPEREALMKLVEAYNKANPGVSVVMRNEFSPAEKEDYEEALSKEFDCFLWYPTYTSAFNATEEQKEPSFLSLDALIETEGPEFLQDFDAGLLSTYRKDGALYGLPAFNVPQIMAYNIDLLQKRGIEPPNPGWTFDDFVSLVTEAASTSAADRSYGMMYSEWDTFLFDSNGVKWLDLSGSAPAVLFDSADFINSLAWMDGLVKSGALLIQNETNWEESQKAIEEGRIAFWITQVGQPQGWYFSEQEPSFDIGVATMPVVENPSSSYMYGSSDQGQFISAQSDNPQACWNWIKFLSEQPTAFTGVPARKSVQRSPQWEAAVGQEYAETYRQAAAQSRPFDPAAYESAYSPISWPIYTWRQEITSALFKGEDYNKVIPKAQQKAEDYLACMASVDQESLDEAELQEEVTRCAQQADPENPQWQGVRGGGQGIGG